MKRFLVFTAVLLSSISKTFACGYTPYGEDIRFSLFLPEYFNYGDFKAFYYNSNSFGFNYEYAGQYESNVYDWYNYIDRKVSPEAINECLNVLTLTDINENSNNEFVAFLYKRRMNDIIKYLKIAKRSEIISTSSFEDTWERGEEDVKGREKDFIDKLSKTILTESNDFLKRKYAFLIIRSSFYTGNRELVSKTFDQYFRYGTKDYLYYWGLYFNCFSKSGSDVEIANVMAYSHEKKYAAYHFFHENFSLGKALSSVRNNQEKANVYAYASIQRLDPNLDYLIKIYANSHKSRILDFLLLREINKIEDWVYTPYYTNYLPSIEFANTWYDEDVVESTNALRSRSEKDRLYAQKVLDFVNSVDLSKVENAVLWKASQIQLLFITRNYEKCLNKISSFEKQYSGEKVFSQIEKLKALCVTANQGFGKAIIKNEIKSLILKYRNDERFLFTIGRELEFKGNIGDGLALISLGNKLPNEGGYYDYYTSGVEWRGNRLSASGNLEYFYEYFDYLDFVYNADEMLRLVNVINSKQKSSSEFERVIYTQLVKDKNHLIDLLGTKFLRENRLLESERAFASIDEKYWSQNYNSWERDLYGSAYAFEENPFYDFKHTEVFIEHKEKYLVTKLSVVQHLNKYLKIVQNPKLKNKDYYCFLVANCYANMSQYGHSWMMRRFGSKTNFQFDNGKDDSFIDEIEYRNSNLAQEYYKLAMDNAKSDKFKALCLRMIDCAITDYPKFERLKSTYPQYYDDLSSCDNLEEYFKSR